MRKTLFVSFLFFVVALTAGITISSLSSSHLLIDFDVESFANSADNPGPQGQRQTMAVWCSEEYSWFPTGWDIHKGC